MKNIILFTLFLATLGFSSKVDISQQITKIQNAPRSKRFQLMNRLKKELSKMNESSREQAIHKMKETFYQKSRKTSPLRAGI